MFTQAPLRTTLAGLAFLLLPLLGTAQDKAPKTRTLVEINTSAGRMVVALYNETPQHRDNFLKLVKEHYYDSTLFHRVIPGFMVQGGDPDSRRAADHTQVLGEGGPGYTIPAEIDPAFIHKKGALAAARQGDDVNPLKNSSGSQFYIVQGKSWTAADLDRLVQRKKAMYPAGNYGYTPEQVQTYASMGGAPHLDGNYTVFGEVVEGFETIDAIAIRPCDGHDRPMTDVRMWMRVLP
ncbi:MAG: peptidylprolyl isomerase [Flavobacteriales bacterium]